ncbi:unnamed protein product [Caenorhabditis bovis]|uniref:Acyl-coenzyme A oxidase n=1 Tax=Caenorhabditis bovis TaxID=2654633 RepID=A0A8S1EFZ8_9PELO|nr:unnamed protein product [Caenorhabditis bovis]
MLNKYIQEGDNADLTKERKNATFDTEIMATEIRGSAERLRRDRSIRDEISKRSDLFQVIPPAHRTRIERLEDCSRLISNMMNTIHDFADVTDKYDMIQVLRVIIGVEGFPLALHNLMFIPTIQNQADDEQTEWWLWNAIQGKMVGTYAQTELGHGTNLGAIETTSTFDRETDEFVLHTPTTTALKWWPGGLGTSCTHVILVANLIIDNKNYGPHPFLVPIRDPKTYDPLPRIRVGDIGTKLGVNNVDNGYLGLDHYRIPRRFMLMKHSKVSREGVYSAPVHPKVAYTTMLYVRSEMITHQANYLMIAMNIAIRYSAVRRQGEIKPGTQEVQILDYQTQQYRLFPGLARCFVFTTAASTVRSLTEGCLESLAQGNSDILADLHNLSCGLKAVVTQQASESIDQARQACGGHGYSDASYLPTLFACAVGACTYEGENIVLLLQLAKYLMKVIVKPKEQLGPLTSYLADENTASRIQADSKYVKLIAHFEHIARRRIRNAYDLMKTDYSNGIDKDYAFYNHSVDMTKAARAHTKLFIATGFVKRCQQVTEPAVRQVYDDLLDLYLSYELVEMSQDLLFDGYLSTHDVSSIRNLFYDSMKRIRVNAVSIVDSFDFSDGELRSVLGRRDGHVYENLIKWAEMSPLNRKGLPHVEKYLKPVTSKL